MMGRLVAGVWDCWRPWGSGLACDLWSGLCSVRSMDGIALEAGAGRPEFAAFGGYSNEGSPGGGA